MLKKSRVVIVILVISALGMVFLAWQAWPQQNLSESAQDRIDISEWKTYRNEELGFEMNYPDFMVLHENIQHHDNPLNKNVYYTVFVISFRDQKRTIAISNTETGFEADDIQEEGMTIIDGKRVSYTIINKLDDSGNEHALVRYFFQPYNSDTYFGAYWISHTLKDKDDMIFFKTMLSTVKLKSKSSPKNLETEY